MKKKTKSKKEFKVDFTPQGVMPLLETLVTFICVMLPHYVKLKAAKFHWQLSRILIEDTHPLIEIIGFRGSAKSTYASLALPLYAALTGKYKFIVLVNDTTEQVRINLYNIKYELEQNEFVKVMFPHIKVGDTWSEFNLILSNGTRIIGRSRGQNIRGIRHIESRPDLLIVDDPENLRQVRTQESRDATMQWFNAEVVPAAQEYESKLIVIGNLLHNDGFMARLSRNPLFKVFRIPLIDEDGECTWKEKYPDQAALDRQHRKVGDSAWNREYLLKVVAPDEQVIRKISHYKELPKLSSIAIGVDLAISKEKEADYSAITIAGKSAEGEPKFYVMENRYGHWNFNELMEQVYKAWCDVKRLYPDITIMLGMEDVAYQKAALEEFYRRYLINPTAIRQDKEKKARLEILSPYFHNDQVLFAEEGLDKLENETLYFGIEKHDDCVDSMELALRQLINTVREEILWL